MGPGAGSFLKRVVAPASQQAVRPYHLDDVVVLDRDLDVPEALVLEDPHLVQGAGDQSLRGGSAVAVQHVQVQGSGVGADANGYLPGGRLPHDRADVRRVADVAGVQPQAVDAGLQGHEPQPVGEVDVGHDRNAGIGYHGGQSTGVALVRHRHLHYVRPLGGQLVHLLKRGADVFGLGDGHRLDGGRRAVADLHVSDSNTPAPAPRGEHLGRGAHRGAA